MEPLAALVARIQDREVISSSDSTSTSHNGSAWLDEILEPWVKAEKEFWKITLEQDELKAYTKAVSMQLIGEDEYTVPGFRLSNYERPSVKRKRLEESSVDRAREEHLELELKERRRNARTAIARDRKAVNGLTTKVAKLKKKISQYEQGLKESSREFDKLLAECLDSTLAPTEELLADFETASGRTASVQRIARALSRKYQAIEHFWESHKEEPHSLDVQRQHLKEVWSVSRAVTILESEVYHRELAEILDTMSNGGPEFVLVNLDREEVAPSVAELVEGHLDSARKLDQLERVKRENRLLTEVDTLLRRQLIPALCFLYTGLLRLQTHVNQSLAQCDMLLSELESMQRRLEESNFQAELDEDDELLIQLAKMLSVQADANGELSDETVLQRLKELCDKAL